MRRLFLFIFLGYAYLLQAQIVANHTAVDRYDDIPQYYIDAVKTMLVSIPGESHSTGYSRGLELLERLDPTYRVEIYNFGSPSASTSNYLRSGRHREAGESIFFSQSGQADTRSEITAQYNTGNPFDVVGFGWCYDMTRGDDPGGGEDSDYDVHWAGRSEGSPQGSGRWGLNDGDQALTGNSVNMDTYLEAIVSFNEYCEQNSYPTKYIFTTGPVDRPQHAGSENGFQREIKHDYIRDFVDDDPGRILFDYADILCWNNQGNQYMTDWNDGGTIRTHAQIHPDNMMDYNSSWNTVPHSEDGDHIGEVGTVRLAKAMWWLLARMAGWDGTGVSSSESGNQPDPEDPDLSLFVGSDYLRVNTSITYDQGRLRIYDMQGRKHTEMNINGNSTDISTAAFAPGSYLVMVSKDNHIESGKVIVNR